VLRFDLIGRVFAHETVEIVHGTVVRLDRDARLFELGGDDFAADHAAQQLLRLHELGGAERFGLDLQKGLLVSIHQVRASCGEDRPPGPREGGSVMYVLEVMSGPLDGKTWAFEREITVGRDDAVATACITIDRYISRKHARLYEEQDGRLRLADLASRNGTRVGGRALGDPEAIDLGEPFVIGRTTLRVIRS